MYVDTHTHIYMAGDFEDPAAEVREAIAAGVDTLVMPGTAATDFDCRKELADLFPGHVFLAAGIHPTEMGEDPMADVDAVEAELAANPGRYVAVGEVGMDLYWDASRRLEQRRILRRQGEIALARGLPMILHCREGLDDTLDVLASLPDVPRAVFHSFTGTPGDVERIRALSPDFYFGINGIATFKNARLGDTLAAIGPDHILLETDAPWLAPVPYRGKRNTSAYIPLIAASVAAQLALPVEEVARATTANAARLFDFGRRG